MSEKPLCNICCAPMTDHESLHQDCGGDCLLCMAEVGDDACVAAVLRLARGSGKPLTEEQITHAIRDEGVWYLSSLGDAFKAGARYAETHYGITPSAAAPRS